jgi:hypothetical protein
VRAGAPGLVADAISYVKTCALSALTVPQLSFQWGRCVRRKRLTRVCENQDLRIQSRRDRPKIGRNAILDNLQPSLRGLNHVS